MSKRITAALAGVALTLALGLSAVPAIAAQSNHPLTPGCHNDTHLPNNFNTDSPKGGDPNIGLKPGSANNPGGYYYLDLTACGTTVTFTLDTVGCWDFQFFDGRDHHSPRITKIQVMDHTISYTYTHATPGHVYAGRVANIDPTTVTDHSRIDSH